MQVAVLGGGSWGTALAHLLAVNGHAVTLLVRDESVCTSVNKKHENYKYLKGLPLCPSLQASTVYEPVIEQAELVVWAVPCQQTKALLQKLSSHFQPNTIIVNASKGIEVASLQPVSALIKETVPHCYANYAILSGPSFAKEVMQNLPTAVVLASFSKEIAQTLQTVFSNQTFRTYASSDVLGVEFGGAVKNIIALAAGLSDGLQFGHNARAGLITRGLAEMSRLGVACGGVMTTFMGLSGMGDLVLTCTGDLSRNRQVGLELAKGHSLETIVQNMGMVAEGVQTTFSVQQLAKNMHVEMPITEAVHAVLSSNKKPLDAVKELMQRALKEE